MSRHHKFPLRKTEPRRNAKEFGEYLFPEHEELVIHWDDEVQGRGGKKEDEWEEPEASRVRQSLAFPIDRS